MISLLLFPCLACLPCDPYKQAKCQRQGPEYEDTSPARERHPEVAEPA